MKQSIKRVVSLSLSGVLAASAILVSGVVIATPARASTISVQVPDVSLVAGLVLKFSSDDNARNSIEESVRIANTASLTTPVTAGVPVGDGWYSISFGQGLSRADANRIIDALKLQSGVLDISIDTKIAPQALIRPVMVAALTSSSYQLRSYSVKDGYSSSTPLIGKIKISWKRPYKNPSRYTIQKSTNGSSWVTIASSYKSTKSAPSYTVSNLDVGKRYYFRVRAKYTSGVSKWSTKYASATAKPQFTPVLGNDTVAGVTTFAPSWCRAQTALEKGGYSNVTYRVNVYNSTGATFIRSVDVSGPGSAVSGFDSNLTYKLKVALVNGRGVSSFGNSVAYSVTNNRFNQGTLWHLNGAHGVNADCAWPQTSGSTTVTVAVIDTGLTDAPDVVASAWLNNDNSFYGYDFVSDSPGFPSNDGDDEDSNPADPGDYISDTSFCGGTQTGDSSWHGTSVSSLVAGSGAPTGIIGVAPNVKILGVRALGPCGGASSSLARAIKYAAGIDIPLVSNPSTMIHNLHPAKVINISMGTSSASTCGSSDPVQQALNAVNALPDPPIVVTAAGNFGDQGLKASQSYPGNCGGTINVGATGNTGDKSFYTNLGWGSGTYSGIDISAPGGDYNPSQSINNGLIAVASNSGPTTQVSGGVEYVGEEGTSFSAPIVAGVIALMASVKPNLTISSAISILDATDTPFAAGTKCQRLTAAVNRTGYYECGPGIVNAGAAVAAALAAN